MVQFDHERFDVYRAALDFMRVANDIVGQLPRGWSHLADQLLRAATSIVLNIAEGAGEFSTKDKARFYRMAKRSATECAAVLDLVRCIEPAKSEVLESGRSLLLRIVSMLVGMVRAAEGSAIPGRGTGRGTDTGTGTETGTRIAEDHETYNASVQLPLTHEFIG